MENPIGTAWTADGEGAILDDLLYAVRSSHSPESGKNGCDICGPVIRKVGGDFIDYPRTNLRLTGSTLTAQDIARILSPEFKVGGGK